jgi:hypothetical protein
MALWTKVRKIIAGGREERNKRIRMNVKMAREGRRVTWEEEGEQ